MTIIRGISLQNDVDSLELSGLVGLSGGSVHKRQNSFLNETFQDFCDLLTPTTRASIFNFEQSLYTGMNPADDVTKAAPRAIETPSVSAAMSTYPLNSFSEFIKEEQLSPVGAPSTQPQLMTAYQGVHTLNQDPVFTQASRYSPAAMAAAGVDGRLKHESVDSLGEGDLVTFASDGSFHLVSGRGVDETAETARALQELQAKIQRAIRELNIPKDPCQMTCEQVNKWVRWILTQFYDMEPCFTLELDGTRLCTAPHLHTLMNNQPEAAEIIRIELDLWLNALSLEQRMPQPSEARSYLDLSNAGPVSSASYPSSCASSSTSSPHLPACSGPVPTPTSFPLPTPVTQLNSQASQRYSTGYSMNSHGMSSHNMTSQSMTSHAMTSQHTSSGGSLTNEIQQQMQFELHQGTHQHAFPQHFPSAAARNYQPPSSLPIHIHPQLSPLGGAGGYCAGGAALVQQQWNSPGSSSCDSEYSSPASHCMDTSEEESRDSSPMPEHHALPRGTLPHSRNSIKLWQFLRTLLDQPGPTCIRWVDREKGIFKIEDSQKVAKLWGQRKNRPAMNYDKLSRSIRQYYKKKIIKKTDNSKRLVYQFCTPYL